MTLIHAELDGELEAEQRGELARRLLAEPETRVLRDQLQDLCRRLDELGQVEPPSELKGSILSQLRSVSVTTSYRSASYGRWRLAAMAAGVLMAGAIVYETMQGPAPGSRDSAGTIAADSLSAIDSVAVGGGPVIGQATLYRDKSGLAVGLDVSAAEPVDVLISTPGYSNRINGLRSTSGSGTPCCARPPLAWRRRPLIAHR